MKSGLERTKSSDSVSQLASGRGSLAQNYPAAWFLE